MSSALQAAKRIRAEAKESGAEKLRPGNKKGLPLSSKPEFMVLITTVFFVCKAFSACSVKDYGYHINEIRETDIHDFLRLIMKQGNRKKLPATKQK